MTSPDDVLALARAVMLQDTYTGFMGPRCRYCYAPLRDQHHVDCPVPIAQRVIAEADRGGGMRYLVLEPTTGLPFMFAEYQRTNPWWLGACGQRAKFFVPKPR